MMRCEVTCCRIWRSHPTTWLSGCDGLAAWIFVSEEHHEIPVSLHERAMYLSFSFPSFHVILRSLAVLNRSIATAIEVESI